MLVSLGRDVKWYRQELRNITDLNVNLDHLLKVSEADVAWKKSELDNASRLTELERKGKEKMTVEHMKLSSQLKEKEATISRLSSTLVCRTAERDSARTEIQHHKDFAQIHGNRARELNEENAILRQKIKQAVGPCSDHEVLSKLDEISTAKKGIQEYVSGLEEKNKKLESQLEEQTITLEEHSGCTAKIADLEGQIKDHQACRDKLRALETDNMQCTGKITNLANEVKTLQDYKMKFDDEASKSAKLQRMHDGLKSELRLSKKSIRNLEEENASDVRVAGFYAVQMFLATFCADHKLDIPADYAPGRDPPDMEATPIVADDEGDAENAIRIHSGSDDESAEEEENAEDDRDLQPKTHDSHHDGGKDASIGNEPDTPEYQRQDANDPNQGKGGASTNAEEEDKDTSTKDPNMVNNP